MVMMYLQVFGLAACVTRIQGQPRPPNRGAGFLYKRAFKGKCCKHGPCVTFSEMRSHDADLKPQEEEEMEEDSPCENGMPRDEGHIDVHSHTRVLDRCRNVVKPLIALECGGD